ncbi:hypothetical protein J40TS1_33930 [Paenibacillus montaniterrae]|uniref:N-acetylmuramoyl-L-alanine amidase domain-containing protein n=1 Tax=Paenibacillus montaniterrae TaxID=429341 RepID=A0A920CYB6_9BACL|nr:peptidoglycan recognition family protein [Paenibacillus montaniterrae]GIP17751.1 hypothetical protein J40TS1_33930 [Paenibacillus montaniterrae]
MQRKGNFLLMDIGEFRGWLQGQSIARTINKLHVHHTAAPNYATRRMINGVAQQDHFTCLEGMRNHHVNNNKWSATGQNITVFEDGKIAISLDRDLNKTPAGISGANTGALCIEIIGNFDKGGDTMTQAQRDATIHLYACLCERLKIVPSTNTIVYHAWYSASGVYLGDYIAGKSSKTCPGTNFMGVGNSIASAKTVFIPLIQDELKRLKEGDEEEMKLSDSEWKMLENNIAKALDKKVISDQKWLEKVQKRTITNSELNWLNNVIAMRLLK